MANTFGVATAVFKFKDAFWEKFGTDFCSSVFRVPLKAAYLDQKGETLRSSIVVDRVVTPLRKRLERQKVRVGGGGGRGGERFEPTRPSPHVLAQSVAPSAVRCLCRPCNTAVRTAAPFLAADVALNPLSWVERPDTCLMSPHAASDVVFSPARVCRLS